MKKLFLFALMCTLVSSPLFAARKKSQRAKRECYQNVQEYLASSAQFSSVLRSLDTFSDSQRVRVVTCELDVAPYPERRYIRAPEGPEPRNHVSANITLTVENLVDGNPLGGSRETLHMDGTEYVTYGGTALKPTFEVETVEYSKGGLRDMIERR